MSWAHVDAKAKGKVNLTVYDDIYEEMQERLVGYFLTRDEALRRKVSADVVRKISIHSQNPGRKRSGSKLSVHHRINIKWQDYDSGEVREEDLDVPKYVKMGKVQATLKEEQSHAGNDILT